MAVDPLSPAPKRRKLPIALDARDAEARTWLQMVRTYSRIERRMEQLLAGHGLSLPQFDVLATLRSGEGITQQELAERLLVTKGNVCALLDRVESAGWVERRPDPHDRRANRLFLTGKGRSVLGSVGPAHHAQLTRIMQALRPSEIQLLYQFLDRLEAAANEAPPDDDVDGVDALRKRSR